MPAVVRRAALWRTAGGRRRRAEDAARRTAATRARGANPGFRRSRETRHLQKHACGGGARYFPGSCPPLGNAFAVSESGTALAPWLDARRSASFSLRHTPPPSFFGVSLASILAFASLRRAPREPAYSSSPWYPCAAACSSPVSAACGPVFALSASRSLSSLSLRPPYASARRAPPTAAVERPRRFSSAADGACAADGKVSLAKLCAERNLCSRREAENFCVLGLISVDGCPVDSGQRAVYVHPGSRVELLPRAQRIMDARLTVILNKPMHYLSCQVDRQMGGGKGRPLCRQLLVPERRWSEPLHGDGRRGRGEGQGGRLCPAKCNKMVCAGRLDVDSTGLTVFTQDGRIASLLVGGGGSGKAVGKEYYVEVDLPVSAGALTLLRHGLALDGLELLPANVRLLPPLSAPSLALQPAPASPALPAAIDCAFGSRAYPAPSALADDEGLQRRRGGDGAPAGAARDESEAWVGRTARLSIELFEGRHRQIRRMCELVGLRVLRIHRVRIGKITLGSLPSARWRLLLPHESFV
ncbi:putative pseudouridylate synthase [Besnoitia besnoiti]|uniref:Putative pseudouridylate synthase n=1 Tax=Besnoitia besnoiti TaxID=94643 RepID=A0A2A9MBX3_BESBE|nr:putative pseudouridylate synthase [Besnoitia besnoiti]PFH32892.1 putative pseudouridylate synthase [Besnoitia besnoiti]